jgi:hypothetical protein
MLIEEWQSGAFRMWSANGAEWKCLLLGTLTDRPGGAKGFPDNQSPPHQ